MARFIRIFTDGEPVDYQVEEYPPCYVCGLQLKTGDSVIITAATYGNIGGLLIVHRARHTTCKPSDPDTQAVESPVDLEGVV